jgi:putative flippase GtrA
MGAHRVNDSPQPAGLVAEVRKFVSYAIAGFASTGAHYLTMIALVWHWGGHEIIASCIGFAVGACVKYPLNYWWNFRSRQPHLVALPRFVAGLAIGFALNAIVLAVFLQMFDKLHYMVSQVLTTGVVLFANYAIARLWIFRAAQERPEDSAAP